METTWSVVFLLGLASIVYGQVYDGLYNVLKERMMPTIPMVSTSEPVQVDISITLLKITPLPNDVVEVNCWLTLNWQDSRLAWTPDFFYNLSSISVCPDDLWTPDVTLYNAASDGEKRKPVMATVLHSGSVAYVVPTTYRVYCPRHPNPSGQTRDCELKFGSWTHNGLQMDLRTDFVTMDLSVYIRDSRIDLLETRALRSVQYYPCCPEPYPDVIFSFRFREFPAAPGPVSSSVPPASV